MKNATTKTLTIDLNELRVVNGKNPIKAWKESKSKLVIAIEKERLSADEFAKIEKDIGDEVADADKKSAAAKKSAAKKKIEKALTKPDLPEPKWAPGNTKYPAAEPKGTASKFGAPENTFTIVELAIQLNINPKVARAKLRRTADLPETQGDKGWVFLNDVKDALIKILT